MDITKLVQSLHPLERKVLPVLERARTISAICAATGLKDVEVVRALQWLENKKLVRVDITTTDLVVLGSNGERYRKEGLPERRLLQALGDKEFSVDRIAEKAKLSRDELNVCIGLLRQKALIHLSKDKVLKVKLTEQGKLALKKEFLEERFLSRDFPASLSELSAEENFVVQSLRKRKDIIKVEQRREKNVTLLPLGRQLLELGVRDEAVIDALTPQIILSQEWKKKTLRRYDVTAPVPMLAGGRRHFVSDAIQRVKNIWVGMGFQEMSGSIVQPAFWNLDALFIPQDHPAREMQDTFYLKLPSKAVLPKELVPKVKAVHEHGGNTGSLGWQQPWSEEKAKELLLRTHNTVLSAQAIARLTEKGLPARFFSIARVFRNETLDWKHLFEFHQVEGIVVDPGANLKHLIGYVKEFFTRMGFKDVRVRPSHFPYTEPSLEVEVLHPVRNEWVELGGAGIFRPEVVQPLLGKAVPVLAWGLGLERIITDRYNIADLRDLYKNDVRQLKEVRAWVG